MHVVRIWYEENLDVRHGSHALILWCVAGMRGLAADAADSAARGGGGACGRGPCARGGAARRRDAARLSVETRGPPALAARAAARPPRALVTRRSSRFALPTIVN